MSKRHDSSTGIRLPAPRTRVPCAQHLPDRGQATLAPCPRRDAGTPAVIGLAIRRGLLRGRPQHLGRRFGLRVQPIPSRSQPRGRWFRLGVQPIPGRFQRGNRRFGLRIQPVWDQHGNRPRFRYAPRQRSGGLILPCFLPFLPLFPSVNSSPSKDELAQDGLLPRFLRRFPMPTTRGKDDSPLAPQCGA
jgi:hypothetical protein